MNPDPPPSLDSLLTASFETRILPAYLQTCRWFGGKTRSLRSLRIADRIPIGDGPRLILVDIGYTDGGFETYLLPLQIASGQAAVTIQRDAPHAVIARFQDAILFDAVHDDAFRAALFDLMASRKTEPAQDGSVAGIPGSLLAAGEPPPSRVLKVEQSNTSIIYQDRWFLKLYRRIEEGINPDVEILRFLSERRHFQNVPPFGGSIEYRRPRGETCVLGLLLGLVPNEGDAWTSTLHSLGSFYDRILETRPGSIPDEDPGSLIGGDHLDRVRLLGRRTAQMHSALSGDAADRAFAPESFTALDQRSTSDSMRASLRRAMTLLRDRLPHLDDPARSLAVELAAGEAGILARIGNLFNRRIHCSKIRTHGDFHLGQVLNTGPDFVIIDFEGEPTRSLAERKLKGCPLRDVAGMMRSFHYAAHTALSMRRQTVRSEDILLLETWADHWANSTADAYLRAYLQAAHGAPFLPDNREDTEALLDAFLLEKALYEIAYELNNRPAWISIPLRGIRQILKDRAVP